MKQSNRIFLSVMAIVGGLLVVMLMFGGWWISTNNRINNQQQDVEQQWSQVENVMQRRYDLVPNLTAAVKGSMHQEQKVFGDIAKARSAYNSANTPKEKMQADSQLNKSTSMLINVIHENYPKLASNENVKNLMVQLEGSENRISVERQNYIAAIRAYNQTVINFPSSIVAQAKGAHTLDYFKATTIQVQNTPKVNLDD